MGIEDAERSVLLSSIVVGARVRVVLPGESEDAAPRNLIRRIHKDDTFEVDGVVPPELTESLKAGDMVHVLAPTDEALQRLYCRFQRAVLLPGRLRLALPERADRIQLRAYMRVKCTIEAKLALQGLEFDCTLSDISGAGSRVLVIQTGKLMTVNPNEVGILTFMLPPATLLKMDFEALGFVADAKGRRSHVYGKFIGTTEAQMRAIVRFVFQIQALNRRKSAG